MKGVLSLCHVKLALRRMQTASSHLAEPSRRYLARLAATSWYTKCTALFT